jgi:alpha-L-fucosidase 2
MEWDDIYEEVDPQHRHVSHLWGLYPGYEIRTVTTPKLTAAAHKSLAVRGDSGTGWGIAYKMALWARLRDKHRAYDLLRRHLQPIKHGRQETHWSGGTYPNLFCAHPPFQIDGNFGATAAIAETLLQSSPINVENNGGYDLTLLPALPVAWAKGEVAGLCARGGFQLGMHWEDGKLTRAKLVSHSGLPARVYYGSQMFELHLASGETALLDGDLNLISSPMNSQ